MRGVPSTTTNKRAKALSLRALSGLRSVTCARRRAPPARQRGEPVPCSVRSESRSVWRRPCCLIAGVSLPCSRAGRSKRTAPPTICMTLACAALPARKTRCRWRARDRSARSAACRTTRHVWRATASRMCSCSASERCSPLSGKYRCQTTAILAAILSTLGGRQIFLETRIFRNWKIRKRAHVWQSAAASQVLPRVGTPLHPLCPPLHRLHCLPHV